MRRRWLAAPSLLLIVLAPLLGTPAAAAETSLPSGAAQVVLLLVPHSSWADIPRGTSLDGWAKANMAITSAKGGWRESDVYLTISKGGRSSGLGEPFNTGSMSLEGDRLTFLDWPRFVEHDKGLRYGGRIGTFGKAIADARVTATVITDDHTSTAFVLADRNGVVNHVVPGGGALAIADQMRKRTQLIVAEASVGSLPLVLDVVRGACTIVASSSMPLERPSLGALAISPECGLGRGRLVSASTRQPDYVMVADLLPTTLQALGLDPDVRDEASAIRPVAGHRTATQLADLSHRARLTGRATGYFNALAVAAVLLGLFATQMSERWRRRSAACLLALPGSILLIDVVPWWRAGVAGGLVLAAATAAALGAAASLLFERRPQLLVGALTLGTAVLLGVDAATGGHLELDSAVANNAIGGGRFSGMGNVPYGFFVAACLVTAGLALDHWGRKAVAPLAVGLAAAVVVDGAPTLGADVGGVLAAVPAYALVLLSWRRPLPLKRLAAIAGSGVLVLAAFAAYDVSQPAGSRTHLGRTLANGDLVSTFVRRELKALQSFQTSTWCVVLLVVLVGLAVMWAQLPTSRPLRVTLASIAVAAFLGTFLNDSGVSVAGAMAAVAWPAFLVLLQPAPLSAVTSGDTAPRRRRYRLPDSGAARSAR